MAAKGTFGGQIAISNGGLRIVSGEPTMLPGPPGREKHKARSGGGSRIADVSAGCAPVRVRPSDLHTTGTSTTNNDRREDRTPPDFAVRREDRTPPDLDLGCAVRPSVLSPTGTSATEGRQFQSVSISPGCGRPTRIVAECDNHKYPLFKICHSASSSPTTP